MPQLLTVYSALNSQEASLVGDLLSQAGIRNSISGDNLQNNTDLGLSVAPEIMVFESDFERARIIVENYAAQTQKQNLGPAWNCADCGEENDAGFDLCWNCQSSRTN